MRALPWVLAAGAVCLLVSVLLAPPPAILIDVGAKGDARFLWGFHEAERSGPVTFRWAGPDARVVLHGSGAVPLVVGLRAEGPQAGARVRIFDQGSLVGVVDVGPGWRRYRVNLPAQPGPWPRREPRAITLACEPYFDDHRGRRLGVMVDWLRIEPDPASERSWGATFGMALAWLSWICAVGGVAHLVSRRVAGRGLRAPLVWGAVLVATLGLAALLARDPYWTAWLFPFTPVTLGLLGIALLGTACSAGRGEARSPDPSPAHEETMDGRGLVLLAAVLLVALVVRIYQIRELPWAMWQDEARHAMVALRILRDGDYRPIYVPSVQLPALGLYPFTLGLRLWGIHPWSLRPVTALAGALTILPLYALARRLTHSTHVALLAGWFLAISSWHVSISRLSFPIVFDPLLTLTGLWMLLRGLEGRTASRRRLWFAGAGLCVGLALQTYHTGRVAPLAASLLVFLAPKPEGWRARALAPFALVFGVCVAPLLLFAYDHPVDFNRRVNQVFLLAHAQESGIAPLTALDASLGRHLLMFNVKGDDNGRHHAPGRPLLDLVTGIGFVVGLVLLARQRERWESRFVLGALALAALPSVLAVDGPHAMRSIGAAALACLISALGWTEIARRASLPRVYLLAPLALALGLNLWTYFVAMPLDRRVWTAFYPVHTRIGVFVRSLAESRHATRLDDVFVADSVATNDVFAYLTDGLSVQMFTGPDLSRPAGQGALFVLSGYSYEAQARTLAPYLGDAPVPLLLGPAFPGLSAPSFVVYERRGS